MSMNNCLVWAVSMWVRRWRRGKRGYFITRWSRIGWTPHFLYGEMRNGKMRVVSFKPYDTRYKRCSPPAFKGYVAWGD